MQMAIDVVFLDADGRVLDSVKSSAMRIAFCRSRGRHTLELAGSGASGKHQIGDKLHLIDA